MLDRHKLKKFFSSRRGVASFILETEQGEKDWDKNRLYPNNGCHANLLNQGDESITGFYSSVWPMETNTANTTLINYLHSAERSPWKSLLVDGHYVSIEDGYFYIPVTDTTNHQLLCNFAVANRQVWERTANVKFWEAMVKSGFTETEAWFILAFFYCGTFDTLSGSISLSSALTTHYPFSSLYAPDWKKWSTGTPRLKPQRLTKNNMKAISDDRAKPKPFYFSDKGFENVGTVEMNYPWCVDVPSDKSKGISNLAPYRAVQNAVWEAVRQNAIQEKIKYKGSFPKLYYAKMYSLDGIIGNNLPRNIAVMLEALHKSRKEIFGG